MWNYDYIYASITIMGSLNASPITRGPAYQHGLSLVEGWISYYIHYKVWYATTNPLANFHGAIVEVRKSVSNFILHFTGHVVTYACWDIS